MRQRRPPPFAKSLRAGKMTMLIAWSEFVGFLGVAEAWEGVGGTFAVYFYFYGAFGFGAGFAKDGEGG